MKYIIVITTTDNEKDAIELSKKIVSSNLGACIHVDKIKSYYKWKGNLEFSDEFRLMIKTMKNKYKALQEFIIENSKYDTPQIVAVDMSAGYDKYFKWIDGELK